MTKRKIVTSYIFPPIPLRQFDWLAYFEDEGEENSPQGWGSTEQAAIADLLQEAEDYQ